jgi:hypothetical protein
LVDETIEQIKRILSTITFGCTSWRDVFISTISCGTEICTFWWSCLHLSHKDMLHSTHLHFILVSSSHSSQHFGTWVRLTEQISVPHEIVDIKTSLHDVQPKVIVDNIPCHEHKAKMTCLFCRTCDHLVCLDCVSFTHKKHNFEPIEKVLPCYIQHTSILSLCPLHIARNILVLEFV